MASFMVDFWLRMHYGMCFILLLPLPITYLPPTHPPPRYACPEISAHLKKSAQKPILKVRYTKANDLVHTLMG